MCRTQRSRNSAIYFLTFTLKNPERVIWSCGFLENNTFLRLGAPAIATLFEMILENEIN